MTTRDQDDPYVKHTAELYKQAVAEWEAGHYTAAAEQFNHLMPMLRRVLGKDDVVTLNSMTMQALSLQCLEQPSEAEPIFRDVLQTRQQSPEFGMEHSATLENAVQLGECLVLAGRYKEAEPILRQVYDIRVRKLEPLHVDTLASQGTLGACLSRDNQLEEAQRLLRDAYDGYDKIIEAYVSGSSPLDVIPKMMLELVRCLAKAGKHGDAEPIGCRAVELSRDLLGYELTAEAAATHGDVLGALGRHAEAEVQYTLAKDLRRMVEKLEASWQG